MSIILKIKAHNAKKRALQNKICDDFVLQLSCANSDADGYITGTAYTELSVVNEWSSKYRPLRNSVSSYKIKTLKKAEKYEMLVEQIGRFHQNYQNLSKKIDQHNTALAEKQIDDAYQLIGTVEGRKLDHQQMLSIVKESHNQLIIAGAGTGKTTTIVGKIKYLLKSGKCKPEDILVLSFTNASASEMNERIAKETGCKIVASTFHKLGLSIITKVDGIKPNITQINLKSFLKDQCFALMKNKEYLQNLSNYLLYYKIPYKSEFDFKSMREYKEYLKLNPPKTFLGEKVKSYGEMDVANFLYQNNIRYQYEATYRFDTRTEEYAQYHPDFYLPDYDIYIEYFGINKNHQVPSYFSGKKGKTATEAYLESMNWKFNLHKKNHTNLVDCYAYEKMDGTLLDKLEMKLKRFGVVFSPKSPAELFSSLQQDNNSALDGLAELFEMVINLVKSNGYTIEYLKSIAQNKQHFVFITLLEPLFTAYNNALKQNSEIDFNDMINLATEYVKAGRIKNHYSYVIVDEYQDISKARYTLLTELRKSFDYNLFCVGDDWQSIYRFAGSDISYILNFEKYWGKTTINKIETTYRFTKSLIEVSDTFIMQNPSQLKKQIHGKSNDPRFSLGEICGYNDKHSVKLIALKIDELPQNSSVYFIGRYSFDVNLLADSRLFDCQYNNATGLIDVKYTRRTDLKMAFLTAHKSKGLQADYVFIINNKDSRVGFPSMIQNDSILDLLLDNCEAFPFAEERRLYYVALTRAKIKSFFVTVKGKESVFAQELHNRYNNQLKREQFECPVCGGQLVKIAGPYGDFLGCKNYKTTGCQYKRKNTNQE